MEKSLGELESTSGSDGNLSERTDGNLPTLHTLHERPSTDPSSAVASYDSLQRMCVKKLLLLSAV